MVGPASLGGVGPAFRKSVEVLALVWVASQATKPVRLFLALGLSPVAQRLLAAVAALQGKGERYAFATCVVVCLLAAAALFAMLLLVASR